MHASPKRSEKKRCALNHIDSFPKDCITVERWRFDKGPLVKIVMIVKLICHQEEPNGRKSGWVSSFSPQVVFLPKKQQKLVPTHQATLPKASEVHLQLYQPARKWTATAKWWGFWGEKTHSSWKIVTKWFKRLWLLLKPSVSKMDLEKKNGV